MKYLYLLYADESKMPAPGSAQFDAQNDAFNKYFEEIDGKGMFKAGDPVQGSKTSKKEQIGGFYVIEAKDLDEAVATAANCPAAHMGAVEVRPIFSM